MRQFTKEELDILHEYEDRFSTACASDYARYLSPKTLDVIKDVYVSAGAEGVSANWNCSHCVVAFLKQVGKKYYADKEAYLKKAAELVGAMDEVFEEVGEEPKQAPAQDPEPEKPKKRGTKKK